MSTNGQGGEGGGAPPPTLPTVQGHVARPVPAGDTFFERLAAPFNPKPEEDGQPKYGETPAQRDARRLAARLPPGYEPTSGADLTFDPRIAYELALGVSAVGEVFAKYGVPLDEARALIASPVFIQTVKRYKEEVTREGASFRLKAKIQAEDLLTHSYILATDPEVPAAVRADLIKWTAKMAGLEPDTKDKGTAGATFSLNIMLDPRVAGEQGRVIDINPPNRLEEK